MRFTLMLAPSISQCFKWVVDISINRQSKSILGSGGSEAFDKGWVLVCGSE
jgi:hypothetical protein